MIDKEPYKLPTNHYIEKLEKKFPEVFSRAQIITRTYDKYSAKFAAFELTKEETTNYELRKIFNEINSVRGGGKEYRKDGTQYIFFRINDYTT